MVHGLLKQDRVFKSKFQGIIQLFRCMNQDCSKRNERNYVRNFLSNAFSLDNFVAPQLGSNRNLRFVMEIVLKLELHRFGYLALNTSLVRIARSSSEANSNIIVHKLCKNVRRIQHSRV